MPRLRGVDFSLNEIQEAIKEDKPLQISVAFPRQKCNLNCLYCYTSEFEKANKKIEASDLLSLLDDAKRNGVKNLLLPGYGEPFLNKEIWPMLDKARELEMYTTIFTNGGALDKEEIKKLKNYPVTLVVKCNSFNEEKEDQVSGVKNYAKKRNEMLRVAIEEGLNIPDKDGSVRMAVAAMIYKNNADDVVEVIDWAIKNNITPMVSGTALIGNAEKHKDILGETEELNKAFSYVNQKIKEKSPKLFKEIFTPKTGNIAAQTSSLFLEYPSGKLVDDLFGSNQVGSFATDNLEGIWQKDKKNRKNRVQQNQEKIQDLKNLGGVYGDRINADALENKRNEYISVSVEDVFKNNKPEIKKLVNDLKTSIASAKKDKIKEVFLRLAALTENNILNKHKFNARTDDEARRQKIIGEYPEEKIEEFIDYQLREYMGQDAYDGLRKQLEQPDIKIYSKNDYKNIDYNNPLIESRLWSKADWKYNRLYLPENENVAVSFIAAAKSLGHLVQNGRTEPDINDFESIFKEEVRAWDKGWGYLKKHFSKYFDGEVNNKVVSKFETILDSAKQKLLDAMKMTEGLYSHSNGSGEERRSSYYDSKAGNELIVKIKEIDSSISHEIDNLNEKELSAKINWVKFCEVINNTLKDIERDNEK